MSAELKKLAPGERPRERFFHHGAAAVSDQDLLAILLRTGTKGQSVLDVSRLFFVPCRKKIFIIWERRMSDVFVP